MQLNMKTLNKQLSGKPKAIGSLDGKTVYSMLTKGGLSLICSEDKNGDLKVYGAGSHRAISLAVAKQEAPRIVFNELSKSEPLPQDVLEKYLPQFADLTKRLQKACEK